MSAVSDRQAYESRTRGEWTEDAMQRAQVYGLPGALLVAPPKTELLEHLQGVGEMRSDERAHTPDTVLAAAWAELKAAAATAKEPALEDEFHDLFIGLGRGELMPYASWYLTGSIMDRPLARLRQELKILGFERQPGVCEPEDHAAALCEIMSMMITDEEEISFARQRIFFGDYMAWMMQFFMDMQKARSARFYRAVGRFGEQFIVFEKAYLAMMV